MVKVDENLLAFAQFLIMGINKTFNHYFFSFDILRYSYRLLNISEFNRESMNFVILKFLVNHTDFFP